MTMYAESGWWLVVKSRLVDAPVRQGRIIEVSHPDGSPPYVVQWTGDEHTSVVYPGPDAVVMDHPPTPVAGSPGT
jgi:hypothetical protein